MSNCGGPVKPGRIPVFRRCRRAVAAGIALLAAAGVANVAAAPVVGETWTYRVANGYNNEVRGRVEYRVDKVEAGRITVQVVPEMPAMGFQRTEVYTSEGNWLRHPLINHDRPVEYEFAQPYPAYVFPLEPGKSWSLRIEATNPATGQRNSVRVDGEVLGTERVSVPAGAYDTIKVRRRVYTGDFEFERSETHVDETDWYAPALRRPVRIESRSGYMDRAACTDEKSACTPVRGDWNIYEMLETGGAARQ